MTLVLYFFVWKWYTIIWLLCGIGIGGMGACFFGVSNGEYIVFVRKNYKVGYRRHESVFVGRNHTVCDEAS